MKHFLLKIFVLTFAVCTFFVGTSSPAEAMEVEGSAPIVNGDITGAKAEAKKQAMRAAVEAEVGVHVNSQTEVENFMVISDTISVKSDGYVTINRIIKEEVRGDTCYVKLDVTAKDQLIREEVQNLRERLEANVNDSNSRGGISAALVLKDRNGSYRSDADFERYIRDRLKAIGLKALANDPLSEYLRANASDPNIDLKVRAYAKQLRQQGANESVEQDANALLRGELEIFSVDPRSKKDGGGYRATVHASFELIALDSNEPDVFNEYVKGDGATEHEAIENAKMNATCKAMDSLARQALETVQRETRGGNTHIKTTVVFSNVTNYQVQYPMIKAGLENAKCRIIRMARPDMTTLTFFVSTDSYSNKDGLTIALIDLIPGIQQDGRVDSSLGSTKIQLMF